MNCLRNRSLFVKCASIYHTRFNSTFKLKNTFPKILPRPLHDLFYWKNNESYFSNTKLKLSHWTGGTPIKEKKEPKSYKVQLKQAVKDYGATVIVFHVTISLASLGICYLAVSNGLDVAHLMSIVGFSKDAISSTIVTGGSTMVISYAVHKLFAPVRIGITLTATPFIVRYLRRTGILKVKHATKT